jgi:SAM-dependent methyltransferase
MERDPDSWWLEETTHAGREHFDEQHARRYDAKEDAHAAEEVALLQDLGVLGAGCSVIDVGAGTGQFTLAAAQVCERVVALDVSPVMLERLAENVDRCAASNVEVTSAGFLSYRHSGPPADVVYSRLALHHLPDFWKAIALSRLADMLRPGGLLRLWDVVYSFEPRDADRHIEAWIAEACKKRRHRGSRGLKAPSTPRAGEHSPWLTGDLVVDRVVQQPPRSGQTQPLARLAGPCPTLVPDLGPPGEP